MFSKQNTVLQLVQTSTLARSKSYTYCFRIRPIRLNPFRQMSVMTYMVSLGHPHPIMTKISDYRFPSQLYRSVIRDM